MRSKGSHGVFAPSPAAGEGPSGQIAACSIHRLGSVTFCYRFAVTKLKCAAGTLRAYLRRCTNDAKASFVSSRSLAARGSWGTAPSVFWYGAPGGTQGPPGKGGAAERWRVVYPIGIATRHGAKPATTRTHKRNAPPARRTGRHPAVTPRRRQATTNSHNKSQSHSPNKIHYLCDLRPVFPHFVNLP